VCDVGVLVLGGEFRRGQPTGGWARCRANSHLLAADASGPVKNSAGQSCQTRLNDGYVSDG
jgi:hypothetical protein